jgi:glycine cleavage system protein P-like pyridoxal-binding family
MTREEIIKWLEIELRTWESDCKSKHPIKEALKMAVKELKGGDAIKKQVVKEQMIKYGFHAPDMTVTEFVEDLLPIAPTRKKGKWIVEIWNNREHHICSDCQRVVDYEPCYHYCPYCGEEKESEE